MSVLRLAGVAAAALFFTSAAALANTVTIGAGTATITCTPSCQVIAGGSVTSSPSQGVTGGTQGSLSSSNADLYNFQPSNEANQAEALNVLAGTNFSTGFRTDTGGADAVSFSTTAQWIAFKLGAGTFFVKNTSGPIALLIDYVKSAGRAGRGGGLSHYTEFGQVVPVPGALWLMGSGLAAFGFARARRKRL